MLFQNKKIKEYELRLQNYKKEIQEPFSNSYYKLKMLELTHKIEVLKELIGDDENE